MDSNKFVLRVMSINLVLLSIIISLQLVKIIIDKMEVEAVTVADIMGRLATIDYSKTEEVKDLVPYGQDIAESLADYSVKSNEMGEIIIVMYHGVRSGITENNIYHRSIEGFKEDIKRIDEERYYPISIKDYLDFNIDIPYGRTPIVITFDDGLSSSFSLSDENGYLEPRKNTAIEIMESYRKKNRLFNSTATIFINNYDEPFKGSGTVEERLNYLVDMGYDLGNHSFTHKSFRGLEDDEMEREIGILNNYVTELVKGYEIVGVAYPYGEVPANKYKVLSGEVNGRQYNYQGAFLAGPLGNTTNPINIDFDPWAIPRIRGTNNEKFDLHWYLDFYKENPSLKYVSDGLKDIITVPEKFKDKINKDVVKNKKIIYN